MKSFKELQLNENIIDGLLKQNIEEPTKIQELSIPEILENKDLIGESHTGSGKTLAFLTPIFQKIDSSKKDVQALILAPTRELVMQIEAQVKLLSENSNANIKSVSIIGDVNLDKQIKKLKEVKPQIVVGSPGRVLDLIRKKKLKAHTVKTLVLDEGDTLIDNTSIQNVNEIIKSLMRDTQILIFTATISKKAIEISKSFLKNPVIIKSDSKASLNPNIEHMYIKVDPRDKIETLRKLLAAVEPKKALVFINHGFDINEVTEKLKYHNREAFGMHKKITKEQRQQALQNFRNGKINILVSSDISARGLDIDDITHIINLDFPKNTNEYLHRAGRTARGTKSGCTISLVTERELPAIRVYEREFGIKIEKKSLSHGTLV